MSKKKSNQENQYVFKKSYENSFISDVINTYNSISSFDLDMQKNTMRNAIVYIKEAYNQGKNEEEIREMLLNNMNNLFSSIKSPNLINFYQLRTLEYMMDLDLDPYIEEILTADVQILKYENENREKYSANLEGNVKIELCGLIRDFIDAQPLTSNVEFNVLCEKLKNNKQDISDKEIISKYVNAYLRGLQIGKLSYWENQRKNIDVCRKMFYKYKDKLFKIENLDVPAHDGGYQPSRKNPVLSAASVMPSDIEEKAKEFYDKIKQNKIDKKSVISMHSRGVDEDCNVKLRLLDKVPFMSDNNVDNFLLIMTELLSRLKPRTLKKVYDMLVFSEKGPTSLAKETGKKVINELLANIVFQKNLMHARDHLMERIDSLVRFYKVAGCLEQYCDINNSRMSRIYLEDLKINGDALYSKFINNDSTSHYFMDENAGYPVEEYKGTPLDFASDEAIVGMSAFYANRMTKLMPYFSALTYIFEKEKVIKRLGKRPELELEDLGYTDDDLRLYMAMYREIQKLMVRNCLYDVSSYELEYSESVHNNVINALEKYKNVYENYFPGKGFDFYDDIDYAMRDALLVQDVYDIKTFSVKSLLYTAITDKKKNIVNWGVVPEDENEDDKFALIGFDIKTLNAPLFVHMKRDELITFLDELTGDTKLRVYEGANDMYSYSIRQRITTQVLYPLSKEEKKKLLKLEGTGALTDYYKHIRWLQQSNNPPSLKHVPGSRVYDFTSKKIEKLKKPSNQESKKENKVDNGDR